ncbi:sulfurtransferase TusA family protein [Kocuria rhizophila]|nr:sulfurtransferase TusA family protein [Kocuria rhizophila]
MAAVRRDRPQRRSGHHHPTANLLNFLVTRGVHGKLDRGVMLVLGILAGLSTAAKATGEFPAARPDATTTVRSIAAVCSWAWRRWPAAAPWATAWSDQPVHVPGRWIARRPPSRWRGRGHRYLAQATVAQPATGADDTYSTAESLDHTVDVTAPDDTPSTPPPDGPSLRHGTPPRTTPFRPRAPPHLGRTCSHFPRHPRRSWSGTRAQRRRRNWLPWDGRPGPGLARRVPVPAIEAKDVMKTLQSGDHLVIDFDRTQATEAIPQWAATDGHEVTDFVEKGDASCRSPSARADPRPGGGRAPRTRGGRGIDHGGRPHRHHEPRARAGPAPSREPHVPAAGGSGYVRCQQGVPTPRGRVRLGSGTEPRWGSTGNEQLNR